MALRRGGARCYGELVVEPMARCGGVRWHQHAMSWRPSGSHSHLVLSARHRDRIGTYEEQMLFSIFTLMLMSVCTFNCAYSLAVTAGDAWRGEGWAQIELPYLSLALLGLVAFTMGNVYYIVTLNF